MTQREVEDLLGLSPGDVSRYEKGKRRPIELTWRQMMDLYRKRAIARGAVTSDGTPILEVVPRGSWRDAIPQGRPGVRLFQLRIAHLKIRNAQRAPADEIEGIKAAIRATGDPIRARARSPEAGDDLIEEFIKDAIEETDSPRGW